MMTQLSPLTATLAALAASATLFTASSAAFAQTDNHRSIEVYYDDLDVTTSAGMEALQHRVAGAAREVCSPQPTRDLRDNADYRQCMDMALGGARRAIVTIGDAARNGDTLAMTSLTVTTGDR